MNKKSLKTFSIFLTVFLISLVFLTALSRPFISDEFHEAVLVSKIFKLTPYKDFVYYKNLLGYYLKAPILLLPTSWWNKLIISRIFIFCFFSIFLVGIIYLFKKWFDCIKFSLSFTLPFFITQSLLHTTAYRVDFFTMALAFLSLFLILDGKKIFAGILLGISFTVSQKAGLYLFPSLLALNFLGKKKITDTCFYFLGFLVPIILYILVWGIVSDFKTVFFTIFIKDTVMATSAGLNVRWYWLKSFKENTSIYFLAFSGFIPSLWREQPSHLKASLIFTFTLFLEAAFLGQPWPHWFILWCPFLVFPIYSVFQKVEGKKWGNIGIFTVITLCLLQSVGNLFYRYQFNNEYQKFNILLLESFLQKNESYLAGVDVHERFEQKPIELREMYAMNRIKIFNLPKGEKRKLVKRFLQDPPHILFHNYRLREFIPEIRAIFDKYYYHFWGNIFAYKIPIDSGERIYNIPFEGKFLLSGNELLEIEFRNQTWKRGNTFILKPGPIKVKSNSSGSFSLI
ncbi:MAG: hypothetical protein NXH75_02225, partial [Halobacteriovoraceae bacterium]|nr:hypothetical protein [Halobacteriovoraceae bacterium]